MTVNLSSNVFAVDQPGGYEHPQISYLEESQNEYHNSDECKYVSEYELNGQLALFTRGSKDTDLGEYDQGNRVLDPDWKSGYYQVNYARFVGVLSKIWVSMFEDRCKERGLNVEVIYTGIDMPREYNFVTDCALFKMRIDESTINRLHRYCVGVTYHNEFIKYLHDYHSSYDGFHSFMSSDLAGFLVDRNAPKDSIDWEHSLWQLIDFYLWPTKEERVSWNDDYDMICSESDEYYRCNEDGDVFDFIECDCEHCIHADDVDTHYYCSYFYNLNGKCGHFEEVEDGEV